MMKAPESAKTKKKKLGRGLFGLGKKAAPAPAAAPVNLEDDDDSDSDGGLGAMAGKHYTAKKGGSRDGSMDEPQSSEGSARGRRRGSLRGGKKGDQDGGRERSRSASVSRTFRKLVGSKGEKSALDLDDSSAKPKKQNNPRMKRGEEGQEKDSYCPPVPQNIETFSESIDISFDSDEGVEREPIKKKKKKKVKMDGENSLASLDSGGVLSPTVRKKKKKVKMDGENSLASLDSGGVLSPAVRKKKKKVKMDGENSLASLDSGGVLNPAVRKKKKKVKMDGENSLASLDSGGVLSTTAKKKKKTRRLNSSDDLSKRSGRTEDGEVSSKSSRLSKKKSEKKKVSEDLHGSHSSSLQCSDDSQFLTPNSKKKSKVKQKIEMENVQEEEERKPRKSDKKWQSVKDEEISWGSIKEDKNGRIQDDGFDSFGVVQKTMGVKKQRADLQEEIQHAFKQRSMASLSSDPWVNEDSEVAARKSWTTSHKGSEAGDVDESEYRDSITGDRPSPDGKEFTVNKKKLSDFDSFTQSWNGSARAEQDEGETVISMAETLTSLNKQIESQRDETRTLQKKLAEALNKVAKLNEDLRREESSASQRNTELVEVKMELSAVIDEKSALVKSLDRIEQEIQLKDKRIGSLEHVVETQLDTVEMLEERLEQTEEELFKMEDEINRLEDQTLNGDSCHSKARLVRMDSIRMERMTRISSIRDSQRHLRTESSRHMRTTESESDDEHIMKDIDKMEDEMKTMGNEFSALKDARHSSRSGSQGDVKTDKRMEDLATWEKELEKREARIDADREQDDLREIRLDEWERDLLEKEEHLNETHHVGGGDDLDDRRFELEERERMLNDGREALEREKAQLAEARRRALQEKRRESDISNSSHVLYSSSDKDRELSDLRIECDKLRDEKTALTKRQEEEDAQRDKDLRLIQEDINEKLRKLDIENKDLRLQLGAAESLKAAELQKVVAQLEEEISALKQKAATSSVDDTEETVRQLQEEIAEQLAELDEENQRLSERLVKEEKLHKEQLQERDEVILDLEETLEELNKNLASTDDGAYISTILKELTDLKQHDRSNGKLEGELSQALASLKEKDVVINELEENVKKLKEDCGAGNAKDVLAKDQRILELVEEMEIAKKEFEYRGSGDHVSKLKNEIKALKEGHKELKKKLKNEEKEGVNRLKKKDEAIQFMQTEMIRMKKELEKLQKKEKKREGSKDKIADGTAQQEIEDLEEEIDHWKAVNIELEDEVAIWKAEANEWKAKANEKTQNSGEEDDDMDEDDKSIGSLGSFHSQLSKQSRQSMISTQETMNMSHHSIASLTQNDLFFVSNTSSANGIPQSTSLEPSTPSQRALRSVTSLWSKMTAPQPPGAPVNPAYPYSMRGIDDE